MSRVALLQSVTSRSPLAQTPYARRFVVWPHHSDALRRPSMESEVPTPAQALTWNIFRTMELLPPAFWLRRLNAALGLLPSRPAPQTADVQLWTSLPAPPGVDSRLRESAAVDVLIETETAVWALSVCDMRDVAPAAVDGLTDPLALLACVTSWYARRRPCHVGVIVREPDSTPLAASLVDRYRSSATSLQLRLPARSHDVANVSGFGLVTWRQLLSILQEASSAPSIERTEQGLAARAVRWGYDVLDRG